MEHSKSEVKGEEVEEAEKKKKKEKKKPENINRVKRHAMVYGEKQRIRSHTPKQISMEWESEPK